MPVKPMTRKTYKKKMYSNKSRIATKSYVNKMLKRNIETKYFDNILGIEASTTPTMQKLVQINQGLTDITRIGDQINVKSITWNCQVNLADNTNYFRVIIFRYNDSDAVSNPAITDVLRFTSAAEYSWLSPYNYDSMRQRKITIIMDRTLNLDNLDRPTGRIKGSRFFKYGSKVNFQGGGLGCTGGFWIYCVSDSAASSHPRLSGIVRLKYQDA